MVTASAPGKFILFGEHAVVYGKPAIAIAVDRRIEVSIRRSDRPMIDGKHHGGGRSYVNSAVKRLWNNGPLNIRTHSNLPPASGLGSSAALSVATVAALLQMRVRFSRKSVALNAFLTEYEVQGRASPTDTSTSTNGGAVMVGPEGDNVLWTIEKEANNGKMNRWYVSSLELPSDLDFVVGVTGVRSSTASMVDKVKKFVDGSGAGMQIINEIEAIALEGVEALKFGDKSRLGELMNENQSHLFSLGVSHPKLEKLIDAARKHSYGAKLTGAGGGGSMVALTDEPETVMRDIELMGGRPIHVRIDREGVRIEDREG